MAARKLLGSLGHAWRGHQVGGRLLPAWLAPSRRGPAVPQHRLRITRAGVSIDLFADAPAPVRTTSRGSGSRRG